MGDGPHWAVRRSRSGLRQSLWRFDRSYGLGTSPLPFFDRWSVPRVRHLFPGVGVGVADHQQPVHGANLDSDFLDCPGNDRRKAGPGVGLDLGAIAICHVLVDPLDLGHDVFAARARLPISGRTPTATRERLERLGAFRRAVGLARAFERLPAVFSPFLRALGVGAAAPVRAALAARSWACLDDFLFVPRAVAGEECAGFRPFRFCSRRLRPAITPGKRPLCRRHADALPAAQLELRGV